jgi:hypothetical protein
VRQIRRFMVMTASLGWVFSLGLFAAAGNIVNFDHTTVGKTPAEWSIPSVHGVAPRWEVRKDPSAPTSPYVLAQVTTNPHQEEFALAIFNAMSLRDGDVSVRLKPVSGHEDQGGGLVFRYRDVGNYYLVRADSHDGEVAVYKMENGRCSPIRVRGAPASEFVVKHNIQPNAWSILKVTMRGNRFQVYVNHRRLLQADDSSFSGPGKVGLVTVADSVTYFNDFRVNAK